MIVFQINIKYSTILENKRDPPVSGHPNAPRAFSFTRKLAKSEAGNIHILKGFGLSEDKQNSLDTTTHIRTDAASVSSLIEAL